MDLDMDTKFHDEELFTLMKGVFSLYINGTWIKTKQELDIINPATNECIDKVNLVGKEETESAVESAVKAFKVWSVETADTRSSYLYQVYEKINEKKHELAQIITKEMGKSIHNAKYEVQSSANFFKWYAEEGRRVYGDTIPSPDPRKRFTTIKQPVGVVAAITPWNFPLQMVARKLAPALAAGCTVILKPAPEAPLSSKALFEIFDEIGLPKGVVNLVLGEPSEIASVFMESPDVKKITFTGSTEVGKLLIRQSADTVKKVSMELGGHAPFIIFEDADLHLAAEGLIRSKFASTGQQCVCPNRIYVHDSIYDEFQELLTEKVSSLNVGNGLDESNDIGAMVNENAIKKTDAHVKDALKKGAKLLCGGVKLQDGDYANGSFYAPTVLSETNEEMIVLKEETFGPVIPLIRFTSEEEVIEKANNTQYGLVAYFYTKDLACAYRVSEKLEYGMVGVNDSSPFAVQAPFGGVKESGIGREGGYQGLEEYLETKLISVRF